MKKTYAEWTEIWAMLVVVLFFALIATTLFNIWFDSEYGGKLVITEFIMFIVCLLMYGGSEQKRKDEKKKARRREKASGTPSS